MRPVAVIKVGTTTTTLLIAAELSHPLARDQRLLNLFEPGAGERLDAAARDFTRAIRRHGAHRLLVAGGEALRQLPEIPAALGRHGWPVWVLTGEEEGRLAWFGVAAGQPALNVLVDIGGGSTELTADGVSFSLPVGVARPLPEDIAWPALATQSLPTFVGGTADVLARLGGGQRVSHDAVRRLRRRLDHPEGQALLATLDPTRRYLLPRGLDLVDRLLTAYNWPAFEVSRRGLTEGLWLALSLGRGVPIP